MNEFQKRCIELRRQDYTLNEIARLTGRSKASVYVHIRGIALSVQKRRSIRIANGVRASTLAASRRGKSTKKFSQFSKWNNDTVRLVAHYMFDGEVRRSGCSYNNRNLSLIQKVEEAMTSMYSFPPKRYENIFTGVTRISYHNVALAAYINEKVHTLLDDVGSFPKNLKREFLQCFFDDEGCMDFRPQRNMRQIRGYQKNYHTLQLVHSLLGDFGIASFVKAPNEVVISGKKNLERFEREIGFSKGVRINGNRPNSIWKKSLEKRDLLARAIRSFKPIGSNGVHRTLSY